MTTQIQFAATVKGVKVNAPKTDYMGGSQVSRSSVDITLTVLSPARPRPPESKPWRLLQAERTMAAFDGEPTDPKEKKAYDAAARELEVAKAAVSREVAEYRRATQALNDQLVQYAQIVGLMAVFGDQRVSVAISPEAQDMLPGMDVRLIETAVNQDDEDFEDGDYYEEDLEDADEAAMPATTAPQEV